MNNGLQDLNGLSREDLLQLVAAQQTQLRSQQQQQEQQQRLALLGQAGSLFATASIAPDRTTVAQPFLGDLSALLRVSHQPSSISSGGSAAGGLADLLLRHRALSLPPQESSSAGTATMAELLQARLCSSNQVTQAQVQPQAQDSLTAIRQLMLRRELLSNPAPLPLPAASDGLNSLFGNTNPQETLLRGLFGAASAEANQRPLGAVPSQPAPAQTYHSDCLLLAQSSVPAVAAAAAAVDPPTEPEEAMGQDEDRIAPAARGAAAGKKKTKRPLSAYNIFFKEEHAKIIAQTEQEKAERLARGETEPSDDEYSVDEGTGKKRKRSLSTNQPGKRGKRQVDFENLTKVIGKRWKDLPRQRVDEYKRRAEEAMQAYRKSLFQKIRNSVQEDLH